MFSMGQGITEMSGNLDLKEATLSKLLILIAPSMKMKSKAYLLPSANEVAER